MNDAWLEIADEDINVEEIMRQIRERIAQRGEVSPSEEESPAAVAEALWREMIEDTPAESLGQGIPIRRHNCDIVPRHYVIDWRIPILGPIHAVVRRLINAEIRRYLMSSLQKQSHLNRQMLRVLKDLHQQNARLRQEIEALRDAKEQG